MDRSTEEVEGYADLKSSGESAMTPASHINLAVFYDTHRKHTSKFVKNSSYTQSLVVPPIRQAYCAGRNDGALGSLGMTMCEWCRK